MKIVAVETILLHIPFSAGGDATIAAGVADVMNMLLVRVDTADGPSVRCWPSAP
jgi:hypothetical protein